ncbi:SMP-30/gluconolactonase/LRE family protein [Fibrella arboris]|uniref:SMP-30/gluconolactonase/LRE family protein n=1 Tax=Fibrella arboris TaxID=3242486 RepID=UPI003520A601
MIKTLLLLALLPVTSLWAQTYPTIGEVVRLDPRLDHLLAKNAKIDVLAAGFIWAEGPVWVKGGPAPSAPLSGSSAGYLLFSDVPKNTIYRWTAADGCQPFLTPAGYTGLGTYSDESGSNGLTVDAQGRLITCEHGDRRVSAMPLNGPGGKITLADRYQGKRFNSPNDVVAHPNGSYYFTDPPYGLAGKEKDPTRETSLFGVYRVAPSGDVSLVVSELTRPNGLAFSPDNKTLYVAQSDLQQPVIRAYPVLADGSVGKGYTIFDASALMKQGLKGAPDGLKVDQQGNLWATGPGGVLVIAPAANAASPGTLLGRIDTGEATANCAWGDDGHTLYITADMYLCRIRALAKGVGF